MPVDFENLIANFNKEEAFEYASELYLELNNYAAAKKEINYQEVWTNLTRLVHSYCGLKQTEVESKSKSKASEEDRYLRQKGSLNVVKLISKNLIIVLAELTNKIYDTANDLLPFLVLTETGYLTAAGRVASVLLIDLFETYPHHLTSLLNFGASVTYKLIKKNSSSDANIIYLLDTILKNALKSDIDEKFQAKLIKLFLKGIMLSTLRSRENEVESNSGSVKQVEYYLLGFKSLLILQSSSHYEHLLEFSASSTSGSKMKPEAIMAQQHQYQTALLATHKKVIDFGFSSQFLLVRHATVVLLAHVLHNFVDTGRFSAIEYLLESYPLPSFKIWSNQATHRLDNDVELVSPTKKDHNIISIHDSEGLINARLSQKNQRSGIAESLVLYLQLQQFQDWSYIASSICTILDTILAKFGGLDDSRHISTPEWNFVVSQWMIIVEFLIKEGGASVHEVVAQYIVNRFSASPEVGGTSRSVSPDPRLLKSRNENKLFSFKSSKKLKAKGVQNNLIAPYKNPYQLSLLLRVINLLIPYAINFTSLDVVHPDSAKEDDDLRSTNENQSAVLDGDSVLPARGNDYISNLLLSLLVNDSEQIRNCATASLLLYADVNMSHSNSLILQLFHLVTQELNSETQKETISADNNVSGFQATRLFSYALALLSLIKQADSTLLQNSTIAKILSFCTQNLKHSSSANKKFLSNAACWIIMSSLVTFNETSEFVKLNSSQFLVFWKNLLTSQFVNADIGNLSDTSQLNEVMNNLMLRSLSLICLHNYIGSVQSSNELSRLLQFLLVKSYNYLTYLESTFEEIGSLTAFNAQPFNESDFNPNLVSNLIFSNFNTSNLLPPQHRLISLILYNKKVVLQGFIKLAPSLKRDVNSNLVVFLTRVFADAKGFSRLPLTDAKKDKNKTSKSKPSQGSTPHDNAFLLELDEDYNYNFGVTSSLRSAIEGSQSNTAFGNTDTPDSTAANKDYLGWPTLFEVKVDEISCRGFNNDPAAFLLKDTLKSTSHSTEILTTIVDRSIELFQYVFPNLSFKIQFSLLEQLRASLTQTNIDPLRRLAIQVNDTFALNGLLKYYIKSGTSMDAQILTALIDTVEKIDLDNLHLNNLNAETVGMASTMLSKADVESIVARYVNEIVTQSAPSARGRVLMFLTQIYKYSHAGYSSTLDVVLQLIKDPNPIMEHYTSNAAATLLENSLGNEILVKSLMEQIYSNILNDDFGMNLDNEYLVNLRSCHHSFATYSRIVSYSVTSLGPALKNCDTETRQKIRNLLILFANGIGSGHSDEYVKVVKNLLLTLQEILIFDPFFIEGFTNWFHLETVAIIRSNAKVGVGLLGPTSPCHESIFPVSTCFELYDLAFGSLLEMTKVGVSTLHKENVNLAWIAMELNPCPSLIALIKYWVDSKPEMVWFSQVNALFKLSARKLTGPFLELNYQVKLLPLTQRQKKKNSGNIDLKDDEVRNIVNDSQETDDKSEPITWEFRLFLYDIIIQILTAAEKSPTLTSSLTSKIQEIVRMSFLGTTSPIPAVSLKGVVLLDKALTLFGHLEDPVYPGISILEQQQAQVISALVPCYGPQSNAKLIVNAISVSSKFINLPRIKFYSKQRILKTLICLLEEVSSNKFLKFTYLEAMSEYSRKAIQLSILNCWAEVRIDMQNTSDDPNEEFSSIVAKYSELLISLWILALNDLSTLRYTQPTSREIDLYTDCWLNFVEVLTIELEQDPERVTKLLDDDSKDFFFVLFCQCTESLIKSHNTTRVLLSVKRLVTIPDLVEYLLSDEVFGEVVDLLDRLVLIEEETEARAEVIDIALSLSRVYLEKATIESTDDKLLELLRVVMLPLFSIFAFLKDDYDPENAVQQVALKNCNSASNLLILKKLLSAVISMLNGFHGDAQLNVSSCLFYLFAKFYEHDDDNLIGVILPYLKLAINKIESEKASLVDSFFGILRKQGFFDSTSSKNNHVITVVLLLTNSEITLDYNESRILANAILGLVEDSEYASAGIQSIKSLLKQSENPLGSLVVKKILEKLLLHLAGDGQEMKIDLRIALEIVIVFSQSEVIKNDSGKSISLYAALIPLLVKHAAAGTIDEDYLHGKMMLLLNKNSEAFKTVVNEYLDEDQKAKTERLVKRRSTSSPADFANDSAIELKTFG